MEKLRSQLLFIGDRNAPAFYFLKRNFKRPRKKISQVRRSQTHQCRYLPLNKENAAAIISEIVNLKMADIDSKRMQLFIARAKGKKDRYVNLSPVLHVSKKQLVNIISPFDDLWKNEQIDW